MPDLTLFVDTPDGMRVRRIRPASALRHDIEPGHAAEDATRTAAALWGLPDFMFRPLHSTKGKGNLEVGDGLVVAGDLAACVQVKLRSADTSNTTRERLWLDKKIETADRQARGSLRRISQLQQLPLVNERDREVIIDGRATKWIGVVVLDHPGLDDYVPRGGSVVILRRDWEFLFEQLKSTYAVLQYLHHVADGRGGDVELGDEPVRYYRIAQASLTTTPELLDKRIARSGGGESAPVFPLRPAEGTEIVRWVLEDIAVLDLPDGIDASEILSVLAAVDATPLALREDLSATLLRWLHEIVDANSTDTQWRSRRFVSMTHHQVVFTACNRPWTNSIQAGFATLIQLRHQEHQERTPERANLMTVGVLLTPAMRGWDTTMIAVSGEQGLDHETRILYERLWGTWDAPGADPTLFAQVREEASHQ